MASISLNLASGFQGEDEAAARLTSCNALGKATCKVLCGVPGNGSQLPAKNIVPRLRFSEINYYLISKHC